ncbi:MAG: hypothetical protein HYV09_14095 [Deltaproteobacteria bacterium]|nr:hypothetical protein [Deltaproteobacteria bacterium]
MLRAAIALAWLAIGASCHPTGNKALPRGQSATALAVGAAHACVRVVDGTLRCFGDDSAGQLGDGAPDGAPDGEEDAGAGEDGGATAEAGSGTPESPFAAPRRVAGLNAIAEVTAGGAHTCARLEDATVRCWGGNDWGQLGDATTTSRPTPVILPGLRNARGLSAGGAHTCAITSDKGVMCWGRNDSGQLGDGTSTSRSSPVRVSGVTDVEQIAAGTFHTCARVKDGTVLCWGRNDAGQIGDGTTGTQRNVPTRAIDASPAAAIVTGLADSCAAMPDQSVRCWGKAAKRASAVPVIGLTRVTAISLGTSPTELQLCARIADGSIRCTDDFTKTPALVPGIVNAAQIAGGASFSCALLTDGALRCWTPRAEPFPVIP